MLRGIGAALTVLFVTAIIAVTAITLTITAQNENQIKGLINSYHAQIVATQRQQIAGQKALPKLLVTIENAIAKQDIQEIDKAKTQIEAYFASHPVRSIP